MTIKNKTIHLEATVPSHLAGQRLDQALASLFPQHSRSRLQGWIKNKQVTVNNSCIAAKNKLHGNEHIVIKAEQILETPWYGQPIKLNIIYEDEEVIVINKPAGMVVHPAAGHAEYTLVNALLNHEPQLAHLPRAGIIHRLDKDTSGLLVVPRTLTAHTHLVTQLQNRSIKREYIAVVNGLFVSGGTVNAPIGRHPIHRKRMAVVNSGKEAITHFRILERFVAHTSLKIMLETGRTHQIRAHMAHIKHPLIGDPLYNKRMVFPPQATEAVLQTLQQFKRQALHAHQLGFLHPGTQQSIDFVAELPDDMVNLITILRQHYEQSVSIS